MDELEKYYQYLKGKGANVPPSVDAFRTTLSNPENAEKYYTYLVNNKFNVAPSFEGFQTTLGLKKKEQTQQAPVQNQEVGGDVSNQNSQSKSTSQSVSIPENENQNDQYISFGQPIINTPPKNAVKVGASKQFNKDLVALDMKKGGSNVAADNRQLQDYGVHTFEATKEAQDAKVTEAATNSALAYAKNNPSVLGKYSLSTKKGTGDKFSLSQLRNISPFQQKVAELKQQVEDGTLITAVGNDGKLIVARPAGKWNDFKTALSDTWNLNGKINHYRSLSEDEQIKFMEEHKPDEFLPIKNDPNSVATAAGATLPTVGKLVTGVAAGALIGATIPATGGLDAPIAGAGLSAVGAWMMTVPDMAKQAQFNAEMEAYHSIVKANPAIDKKEALKQAKKAGVMGYAEGLATGTAMNFIGGGIPENVGQGFWKATGQFLKNQPQSVAEIATLSAGASALGDEAKKALGVPITDGEKWDKAGKAMNSGVLMQLAFNTAHGVMAAPKYVKAQSYNVLTHVSPEELYSLQQKAVESGLISQEQADITNKNLAEFKDAKSKIIPTGDAEKDAVITGLVQKKANLEKLKSETDKSYHEEIDSQIESADRRIQLAKQTDNPIKHAEQDDLDGNKNFTPKDFENLSTKEVEGVTEEIPKEYGEANTIEVGEGENKKYKAEAVVNRQQGFIKIKDKIPVEDKTYSSKEAAQKAADKALAQHYYENAMDETLKPEQKSAVTVIRPEEVKDSQRETTTINLEETPPETQKSGVSIILPETNRKPEIIPNGKVQETTQPTIQTDEGSSSGNEPVTAEESIPATTTVEEVGEGAPTEETIAQPDKSAVTVQMPPTSLSYSGTGKLETEFGVTEREPTKVKHDIYTLKEADNLLKDGWNVNDAIKSIESGEHTPSDAEYINMVRYAAELSQRLRDIKDVTSPDYDKTLKELNRVALASNVAGKEQGRALGIRGRYKTVAEGSYADFMLAELNANKGADLTNNQKGRALKDFNEFKEAKENFENKSTELEDVAAKEKAEKEITKKIKSTPKAPKKTHEDYVKQRATLKDQLQAAKEKQEKWLKDNNIQQQGASGFVLTTDMAKVIGKIIGSHIEEQVNIVGEKALKLADVIKGALEEVKGVLPDITERHLHDVIAGEYNEKKQTKNEVAAVKENLRLEAQLINKLDALLNGAKPKNEKAQVKRNQQIEDLRKQIKDWNEENPDREGQLNTLKKNNEKETARIQDKIDKKDFEPDVKKTPLLEQKEVKEKYPNLYKEVIASKDALIKKRNEISLRRAHQMYANKSPQERFAGNVVRGLNVPRTLMASMDFSAPLRQSLVATVAHPVLAGKAAKFMFEATKDEKVYNRWLEDVHNDPRWKVAEKTDLAITDPATLHLKNTEEAFLGAGYAEQIPGAGKLVKGSERAYVGFLNKIRWDLFNQFADAFAEKGQTYENSPELYKGLASFVNASTGRGGMAFGEAASPIMSTVLFSPRLIASRLNMLGLTDIPNLVVRAATLGKRGVDYGFYTKLPKPIRIAAAKDMLKFLSVGITTLALAKSMGADVESDPRSTDFGKIRSGNTRWDIWGGFQPYARLLSQVVSGQSKSTNTGQVYDLDGKKYGGRTIGDQLATFGRGKLAPVFGTAADIITQRTLDQKTVNKTFDIPFYSGDNPTEGITITDELLRMVTPLLFNDVKEAMKDKGISALFTVGIPSVFGVGTQTYEPKQRTEHKSTTSHKAFN